MRNRYEIVSAIKFERGHVTWNKRSTYSRIYRPSVERAVIAVTADIRSRIRSIIKSPVPCKTVGIMPRKGDLHPEKHKTENKYRGQTCNNFFHNFLGNK